jgi:hypothetical protein
MSFLDQFPTYPVESFPVIPAGFVDSSWKNDACPSIENSHWRIWLDWPNEADRECGGAQFTIVDSLDPMCGIVFESDDWSAVLAFIEMHGI